MDLVYQDKKELLTNSKVIADMLEVPHKVVMQTIDRMFARQEKNKDTPKPLKYPQHFIKSSFTNKMGREYDMYELNEPAYLKLAMQLSGYEKAEIVQDSIIEAFSEMKNILLRQQNQEWSTLREQTKIARKEETDTIKDFVEYAISQGSEKAKYYYKHLTNATYKALMLLEHNKPKTRDTLDLLQLQHLFVAENMVANILNSEMKKGEHYKAIYEIAKQKLDEYAKLIGVKIIGLNS